MGVALYMDVHVPAPITQQLRQRGVDVLTAQDDDQDRTSNEGLLEGDTVLGRVMFTYDLRFRVLAEEWQRHNRQFARVLFGPQLGGTSGQYVQDLELIATASEPHEWQNVVQFLPFELRK